MRSLWYDDHYDNPALIGILGGLFISVILFVGVLFA